MPRSLLLSGVRQHKAKAQEAAGGADEVEDFFADLEAALADSSAEAAASSSAPAAGAAASSGSSAGAAAAEPAPKRRAHFFISGLVNVRKAFAVAPSVCSAGEDPSIYMYLPGAVAQMSLRHVVHLSPLHLSPGSRRTLGLA